MPYRASRTLAGDNPLLGRAGVAFDVVRIDLDPALIEGWRRRIETVARTLRWPAPDCTVRKVDDTTTLGFGAPDDQLQTAREANEWALCATLVERDPNHWSTLREALCSQVLAHAAADPERPCVEAEIDEAAALERFGRLAVAERLERHRA